MLARLQSMNQVLLNNVDHHDVRITARSGADPDEQTNQVLVFPTEFELVQREFPIVIRRDSEGALRPVALLGLARSENLFLDDDGDWLARYVPALLQRGPFSIAAPDQPDGEPMIRIDLGHPRVSRSDGTPIFLPHGGNSPYLQRMTDVLRMIYVGHHLLDPMIAAFEAAGLLKPINLELRVGENEVYAISEIQIIDRERLSALSSDELGDLHRSGFLQAAFMIAASLGNLDHLVELKSRRGNAAPPSAAKE